MGINIAPLSAYMVPGQMVTEAIANGSFQKATDLIKSYLKRHNLFVHDDMQDVSVEGVKYYGYYVFSVKNMTGAYFLWKMGGRSTELDGVMFTSDGAKAYNDLVMGGRTKFDFGCDVNGISLVKILPFVVDVLNKKTKMDEKQIRQWFTDNQLYESLNEAQDELEEIRKRLQNLAVRISTGKKQGKDISRFEAERAELAKRRDELVLQVRTNVTVENPGDIGEVAAQEQEFEERATPEERFNDMEHYISMVLKGLQPSVLICGAPGLGKTYRVMQQVKAAGVNYKVIKGKETPVAFYIDLFHYKHEGDVLICDDADDVLTDDTITNLIKAATDSSDERIVSYGTSQPPLMSEAEFEMLPPEDQSLCDTRMSGGAAVHTYPKSFITEGSMIIITNKNAGQIDTAVRNRGLLCDLQFTVEECLGLIKDLMPHIMPTKLSIDAKYKALAYLTNLAEKKAKMDISIRSFTTAAKVYEDVDDDKQADRMIKEQMALQAARGGRRY